MTETGEAAQATAQTTPFTDLDDVDEETRQAISCILAAGITRGTSDTTYSPSRPVTRRQMALFLTRLLDVVGVPAPEPADPGFTDLEEVEEEARSAVARLFSHGITKGTTATTFSPSRPVTRGQMALFLTRLLTAAGVEPVSGFVPGFDDTAALSAERAAAIAQMQADDVMRGVSASEFAQTEPVTRDHMAWFLSRALAVAWAGRDVPPPSGCEDIVRTHNRAARPSVIAITFDPQEPLLGDSVTARATLSDRGGNPVRGLGIGLVRDGQPPASHVETGRDGTADLTVDSPRGSGLTSSIAVEVRLDHGTIRSRTTTIRWAVPEIDLTGVTPIIAVRASDSSPAAGDDVEIVATVTDADGAPLFGAEVEFIIDGESRGTAFVGPDGQATFTYDAPTGPSNEGGYDSIQVQVVTTETVSRPVGVFWQQPESRSIAISVSPDRPHTSTARTITATVLHGTSPMADHVVELYIDGTIAGRARTDSRGVAEFTRTAPVHGPFDLARVVLSDDRDVTSDNLLISWPMRTRGVDSRNHWQLVWSDEFNGASLDTSKWTASDDCPPVYLSCNTDRAENVNLADGMLYLRSLREPFEGINVWQGCGEQTGPIRCTPGRYQVRDFTAGRVNSVEYFTFGRIEVLARLPQGIGTFFAVWMAPRRDSPYGTGHAAGELDIAEGVNIGRGGNPRGFVDGQLPGPGWGVHHFVKTGYPTVNTVKLTHLPVNPAESFHLYTIEWDAASVRYYVDDQRVMTVPSSDWFADPENDGMPVDNPYAPFDEPFRLILSNTVGSWAVHSTPGNQVPDTTPFPTEMVVDYVRYYECQPAPGTSGLGPGQGCETP